MPAWWSRKNTRERLQWKKAQPPSSYDEWKRAVNQTLHSDMGFSVHDYPELPIEEWYEEGITPAQAVERVINSEIGGRGRL